MKIIATYQYGDRFDVELRGHRLVVDQPADDGGGDQGPTPTELFVASLAACVGFYAERFLRRHGLAAEDLRVEAHASMSNDRPARVGEITLQLAGLPPMPAGRRAALHAVVEHCTVHNSIRQAPQIRIRL
jgi:putative redox protein